jgi:hypothetical protein
MQMQVDDSASFAWDGKAKYVLCLEAEAAPHAEAETSANSRALGTYCPSVRPPSLSRSDSDS